jgi:hypothetical protein
VLNEGSSSQVEPFRGCRGPAILWDKIELKTIPEDGQQRVMDRIAGPVSSSIIRIHINRREIAEERLALSSTDLG